MRQRLIAGNWKMHGNKAMITHLCEAMREAPLPGVQVALLAPFVFLPLLESTLRGSTLAYGGQDVSEYQQGAYTGETSAAMLKEYGCRYVIVGHSERRALYGDTSSRVAKKLIAASAAGLCPILCVGETLAQRQAGQTEAVVSSQLNAVFEVAPEFANAVIAYEPVWAIGTGQTATPAQAEAVHAFIRGLLSAQYGAVVSERTQILYGGSVKADNAAALFAEKNIDGGLVGGASLIAEDFIRICKS